MLLYVLTQLWGQINPSGFQSPLLVKYDIVFMWIKYFEFEFEFDMKIGGPLFVAAHYTPNNRNCIMEDSIAGPSVIS